MMQKTANTVKTANAKEPQPDEGWSRAHPKGFRVKGLSVDDVKKGNVEESSEEEQGLEEVRRPGGGGGQGPISRIGGRRPNSRLGGGGGRPGVDDGLEEVR